MDIQELYLTLEVYAHLRDLPQYGALKASIEKRLKDANDALLPKPMTEKEDRDEEPRMKGRGR